MDYRKRKNLIKGISSKVKRVQRNRKIFDCIVIKMFKRVFLRFIDSHLTEIAKGTIVNHQLRGLITTMKEDLGYTGSSLFITSGSLDALQSKILNTYCVSDKAKG